MLHEQFDVLNKAITPLYAVRRMCKHPDQIESCRKQNKKPLLKFMMCFTRSFDVFYKEL